MIGKMGDFAKKMGEEKKKDSRMALSQVIGLKSEKKKENDLKEDTEIHLTVKN